MGYESPKEVLETLIYAYYDQRDVEKTLSCVTTNIEWIGTEENDSASGKEELKNLLEEDIKNYPNSFELELDIEHIRVQPISEHAVFIMLEGSQKDIPGIVDKLTIRGTVCCIETKEGWLINNVHTSVPNAKVIASLFKDAVEGAPVGIFVAERETRNSIYANKACIDIGKYQPKTRATGKSVLNFLEKNDKKPLLSQDEIMKLSHEDYFEYHVERNGQYIATKAKAISWNNKDAYIMYITDETAEYLDQEKMKKLINEMPGGIGIYEIENGTINLTYVNDAYYRMLGVSREERSCFYGYNSIKAVYEDDRKKVYDFVQYLSDGATQGTILYRIKIESRTRWIQMTANVVERYENNLTVYVVYSDCEDVMRSQIEMEQAHKREQMLLAHIPGGLAIYRLKKNGTICIDYVSEGLANICGYDTREEMEEIFAMDALANVSKEDRELLKNASEHSRQTGEPINVRFHIHTKKKKDILNRFDAILMEDGYEEDDVAIWYGVHTIVSDEAKNLINEQKRYRNLLNTLDIALFEWSKDTGFYATENYKDYAISDENQEKILKNCADQSVVHPDDLDILEEFFVSTQDNNIKNSATLRLKMKDGSYRWTEMMCLNEYDDNQEIVRIMGVFRDIDKERIEEIKKLYRALAGEKQANEAKTAFLSRVSHDMRTPLNGILGLTALIKSNVTEASVLKDLSELELSGQYLLNLINDTLDVSRIENGKLELHPVVCDGRTVFHTCIDLVKPSIEKKNIKLHVSDVDVPYTTLFVDENRMQQIIMNILGNAVKFSSEGGDIFVTLSNEYVKDGIICDKLVINDNGVGMSKEFLPHLFESFSQEDRSRTNNQEGTGLGMAITKQLVELMDGEIFVESELGKGTCFTIIFKMQIATKEQIEEEKERRIIAETNLDLDGKRVLLCEDHPLNQAIATRLFESKNIIVEHAENGKIAVDMLNASPKDFYDFICMDIRMPVMDGITATKEIRKSKHPNAKTIPIIAMTANAFSDDVKETKNAGMNAHLSKPIDPKELFKIIVKELN